MSLTPAVAAVARVAHLASDAVVDSASVFSSYWTSPPVTNQSSPSIVLLPEGADSSTTLLRAQGIPLLAYTTNASPALSQLLPHLLELASRPAVLHIAANGDLSDVIILRAAIPFFLHSSTAQQAHDNALLASRLAFTESKAVVHVFHVGLADEVVEEVASGEVKPFLLAEKPSPSSPASADVLEAYESAAAHTLALLRRPQHAFTKRGDGAAHTVIITLGRSSLARDLPGVAWIDLSLVSPFPTAALLASCGPYTKHVFVLEAIQRWSMKWTPIFLDVVSALQSMDARPSATSVCLGDTSGLTSADVATMLGAPSTARVQWGAILPPNNLTHLEPAIPKHEASYTNILTHLFGERMKIANSPALVGTQGELATSPEFALGRVRAEQQQRNELVTAAETLLQYPQLSQGVHTLLSTWLLAKDDRTRSYKLGNEIVAALEAGGVKHSAAERILTLRAHFPALSRWIIGSDAWSYDIGASGLHHAVTSGLNINVLVFDTVPYSKRLEDAARRKQDVGLYAMNHGDVFVASIAVYSSYGQVLRALVEADRYPGPSIVLAYLPYTSADTTALQMLKETKNAVDSGYWPLYRWDPSREDCGEEPFLLDSDLIKKELQTFLNRTNHLSQLVRTTPALASDLVSSFGERVRAARKARAQQAYANLLSGIDAPPLLVLYASDGGNAEKKAKRLGIRATARGLNTTVMTLDAFGFEALMDEERHTVLVASTAGQGEPPQNGRQFFKALNAAVNKNEAKLDRLKYTVFGMGDSHYWPRPEDFVYHNKPGKELDSKLTQLGATRFTELGLGDDQAADGAETGYKLWELQLWKALGVDAVEVQEAEPEPITAEHIKAASQFLRGTIAEGFADTASGGIAASDTPLTKMHGIYQQEDRDVRDERQAAGVEPAYIFMVRMRLPAGVCTAREWLAIDQIADEHGAGHFKVTTRQTFQFHGVLKRHVKPTIQTINRALMSTVGACGDVCQCACRLPFFVADELNALIET
jgi:sulfite reductase (NADPH) hemoprotein beta-component